MNILVEHHLCCKSPEWKHFYSMGKCPKYQNTPSLQLFTGTKWTAKPNVCRMIKKKQQQLSLFWYELGFLSQDPVLSQWPKVNKIMTFPVILFSFKFMLCLGKYSVKFKHYYFYHYLQRLTSPCLKVFTPASLFSFYRSLCPFPPQLQVEEGELS